MRRAIAALLFALTAIDARALSFDVTFDDPQQRYVPFHGLIEQDIALASADWSAHLSRDATISLAVSFEQIPTAAASSTTISFARSAGEFSVYHQGAGARLIGTPPPTPTAQALLRIGTDFLQSDLHFTGQGPLPAGRVDARSVFTHELAHVLGINGWRDPVSGALPGSYMSTFDALTRFDGTNFWFTGDNAVAHYGAEVPLTFGNIYHLGNRPPRPGQDLVADMLNGVEFSRGSVYQISALDVAVLCDLDLPMLGCLARGETDPPIVMIERQPEAIAEPASGPLLALVAAWIVWLRRSRSALRPA